MISNRIAYLSLGQNLVKPIEMEKDDVGKLAVDASAATRQAGSGVTVSGTPTWTSENTGVVTVASAAISAAKATALVTAVAVGSAVITVKFTLSDSQVIEQKWLVTVGDTL